MKRKTLTQLLLSAVLLGSTTGLFAQSGEDPGNNPNRELLLDAFLYEFANNKPTKWTTVGTTEELTGRDGYNSSTGSALRITTTTQQGLLEQIVSFTSADLTPGDVVEGQLHYHVDAGPATGALRLKMQWLGANDQVLTDASERKFVDAEDLWFSMPLTWSELRFRSTVPAGATRFRFAIVTQSGSVVRLDDFSLRKQSPPLTPFISILPQVQPAHELNLGQVGTHRYRIQGSGLTAPHPVNLTEGMPFTASLANIPQGASVSDLTVTCTPTEAGKVPRTNSSARLWMTVAGTREVGVPLRYFAIDATKPPTITVTPGTFERLSYQQGSVARVSRELQLSFANMIDDVKISIESTTPGFSINQNSIRYFEKEYPNLGIKIGVNNTKLRVDFLNIKAPVGVHQATLVLSSPMMAAPLRYPISVEVKAGAQAWIEKWSKENKAAGSRYTDMKDRGYYWFDRGVWHTTGSLILDAEAQEAFFYSEGCTLTYMGSFSGGRIYDEDFPAGIRTIKVKAGEYAGASALLALEVTHDNGGTWRRIGAPTKVVAEKVLSFEVNSTEPTRFRLVRTNGGDWEQSFSVKSIEVSANEPNTRVAYTTLAETLDFTGATALAKYEQNFDGMLHHSAIHREGWRNVSFSGNRPWVAFKQSAEDAGNDTGEEVAKVTLFNATRVSTDMPLTAHLVSPLLSYTTSASKELAFRLWKQTQSTDDIFYVYIAPVVNGRITEFKQLDLDALSPGGRVRERLWHDYLLDLSEYDLSALEQFVVIFSLQSPYDGNNTTTQIFVDDFSWGKTDNPKITASQPIVAFFEQQANVTSEIQQIRVETQNAKDVVRTLLESPNAKVFRVDTSVLPKEGGTIDISVRPERNTEYIAALYLMTRGGANVEVRIFSTPRTMEEILPIDSPEQANAYLYHNGNALVVVAPELSQVVAYDLSGVRVAQGNGLGEIQLDLHAGKHYVLKLRYSDGRSQTLKY